MPNDTLIKLSSRLPKASSLDGHADELHGRLGRHYVAIVEFRVADRTEVDPDSDASPKVKLEFGSIEVAYNAEDEANIRSLQQAIYRARTAAGTFDAEDVEPSGEVVPKATDTSKRRPRKTAAAR